MDCSDSDSEAETLAFEATPPRLSNFEAFDSSLTEKKNKGAHKELTNVNSRLFDDNLDEKDYKAYFKRRDSDEEMKYEKSENGEKYLEEKIMKILTKIEEKKQKIQRNEREMVEEKEKQNKKIEEKEEKEKQDQIRKEQEWKSEIGLHIKDEIRRQEKEEELKRGNKLKELREEENARKKVESLKSCKHSTVKSKFLFSFIVGLILTILLEKPKQVEFPITESRLINNKHVFRFVTDESTEEIVFPINKSSEYFFLTSEKSANVKAQIKFTVGYEFENKIVSFRKNAGENITVQMSELKVLDFSIEDIKLKDKTNSWLWETWEFEDYDSLKSYIKKNFVPEVKKGIISEISKTDMKGHEEKVYNMLMNLIKNSESFFDGILRRIDHYVDGGLQPFLNFVEIDFNQNVRKPKRLKNQKINEEKKS